jgi:uncharacterized protein YgbK (DUF1537 family)
MPAGPLRFAAIADDYTGASDLAGMLHLAGIPAVQVFGVPEELDAEAVAPGGAVVVALKTRSAPPEAAVDLSLRTLRKLQELAPRQVQFKYCSTFDSTPRGNIGPVAEALLENMGVACTVAVPALPVNGRTQYLGHLFVDRRLLAESPLRDHPLNPMTDSNLVRWLSAQTPVGVGLVPLPVVLAGPAAIQQAMLRLEKEGVRIALVDAVTDENLDAIAAAVADMPLITGGSGITHALARLWQRQGGFDTRPATPRLPRSRGVLILAGSCSAATLQQLDRWEAAGNAVLRVSGPEQVASAPGFVREAIARTGVATVASSAAPGSRNTNPDAARAFEHAFGELAAQLVREGAAGDIIVAGGETSGAVVDALAVKAARVVGLVAPGVPSLVTLDQRRLWLVLKSGNFGGPDFFADALRHREKLCN